MAHQSGDISFYDQNIIALAEEDISGLGGRTTLWGFKQNRFIGDAQALGNFEIRYTLPSQLQIAGNRFGLLLAPSFHVGKASASWGELTSTPLSQFEYTAGSALRVIWNQATLISVDYGKNREGSGMYINFGHTF